jgi:hypothetical protein
MTKGIMVKVLLSLTAIAVSLSGTAVLADTPRGDVFNRSTTTRTAPSNPVGPLYGSAHKAPVKDWFYTIDEEVAAHGATQAEQLILVRSVGHPAQLEKVIEWTKTAASVAKKYHELASNLRGLDLPSEPAGNPKLKELQTYRNNLADWYDESGKWLEDYISPRPAARTIEELDGQLKGMDNRSKEQKLAMSHLQQMDSELRNSFNVPAPNYDNAIRTYASKRPTSSN